MSTDSTVLMMIDRSRTEIGLQYTEAFFDLVSSCLYIFLSCRICWSLPHRIHRLQKLLCTINRMVLTIFWYSADFREQVIIRCCFNTSLSFLKLFTTITFTTNTTTCFSSCSRPECEFPSSVDLPSAIWIWRTVSLIMNISCREPV